MQPPLHRLRHGFTLIEMMIVIAIFVISTTATIPLLNLISNRQSMSTESIRLMQIARMAQSRSLSGMMGKPWGIYVNNRFYSMFAGTSYVPQITMGSSSSSSSYDATETFKYSIEEPLRACTDRPDKTIVFPQQTTGQNISTFIRLYDDSPGGEERFILIDTIGAIQVVDKHPMGLTCTAL